MTEELTIRTERLLLRPLELGDAETVRRLAGDARIADTADRVPHPYEPGMAEEWIAGLPAERARGHLAFAITLGSSGELVGVISLVVHRGRTSGGIGYWVGVPYWGRGYATEAAHAIIRFALDVLELEEVRAIHLTRNPASGRVLEKAGMVHIGSGIDLVRGELQPVERFSIRRENS